MDRKLVQTKILYISLQNRSILSRMPRVSDYAVKQHSPRKLENSVDRFQRFSRISIDRMKNCQSVYTNFRSIPFSSIQVKVVWTENWYGPNMVWTEKAAFIKNVLCLKIKNISLCLHVRKLYLIKCHKRQKSMPDQKWYGPFSEVNN